MAEAAADESAGLTPSPDGVRTRDQALADEKAHVADLRGADAEATRLNPQNQFIGLALSGGGIRSATFCLGVLQAIAQRRWLRRIDYLSTVSGGGYIGAWLSAVLFRRREKQSQADALREVEQLISPRDIRNKADEPIELAFLRAYSNYLTPRRGFFSADTLAAVFGYLRNLVFNLLLALLSIGLLLAVLHGPITWTAIQVGGNAEVQNGLVMFLKPVAGFAALMCALLVAFQTLDLPVRMGGRVTRMWVGLQWLQRFYGRGLLASLLLILALGGLLFEAWLPNEPGLDALFWSGLQTVFWFGAGLLMANWMAELVVAFGGHLEGGGKPGNLPASLIWGSMFKAILRIYQGGTSELARYLWAMLICVAVGFGLMSAAAHLPPVPAVAMVFRGPALAVTGLVLLLIVWIGVIGTTYSDQAREWLSRLIGVIAGGLIIWTLAGVVVLNARPLWQWSSATLLAASPAALLWAALIVAAVLGALVLGLRRLAGPLLGMLALSLFCVGVVLVVGGVSVIAFQEALIALARPAAGTLTGSDFGAYLDRHLIVLTAAIARAPGVSFGQAISGPWNLQDIARGWPSLLLLGLLLWAAYLAFKYVDVNAFSLQNLYRNRLVRCYLGAAHGKARLAEPFSGFDPRDDLHLSALADQRPYLIVNTALNLTQGADLAWQQRKAASFSFSPRDSGYWLESGSLSGTDDVKGGYAPTADFACEPVGWQAQHNGVLLGTAMATSGAAVSSQMGFASRGVLAFVLTLANVRLGRWFPNPAKSTTKEMRRRSPPFAALWFLRELLGRTDERSPWVYLSDGGHFENLGIYELVRRRCRFIIAVDAGADPLMTFSDLGNAVRKCRVDFGVDIRLDLSTLTPDGLGKRPAASSVLGTVDYPPEGDAEGFSGDILYIKLSMPSGIGPMPADVLSFAKQEPIFPHQSTTDQWFTESQFESYRHLGYVVGHDALKKAVDVLAAVGAKT